MKTIAIVYDKDLKPETEAPVQEAINYLSNKSLKFRAKVKINPNDLQFTADIDAIVVFGGDGLLLHTANKAAIMEIPIIGINYGRIGYLCQVDKDFNQSEFWKAILGSVYAIERKTRISAEITDPDGVTEFIDALNEISIGGIDKTVYVKATLLVESSLTVEVIGDGMIFATQTGSTAYNVNAGGSVLLTDTFSVVANNAIFKSEKLPVNTKCLVTDAHEEFEVEILNKRPGNLPYLIADGQRSRKLTGNEKIIIKKSMLDTRFIRIE